MFQSRPFLAPETVAALTEAQIRQVYQLRLKRWTRAAGFGGNVRGYLESGGATWEEFSEDFGNGKIPVLASELPEVYADEQAGELSSLSSGLVGSSLTGAGA